MLKDRLLVQHSLHGPMVCTLADLE